MQQNLDLHASLFDLSTEQSRQRVSELIGRFDLAEVTESLPDSLPLGIRQRLQLAVAVLHKPEMLILDEPTSGVDPIARDRFWELLINLSREDGVTIFISTHFVNEAERCDRISLMHAGKILAMDTPDELRKARGAETLEAAFNRLSRGRCRCRCTAIIHCDHRQCTARSTRLSQSNAAVRWFDLRRVWAFARREAVELIRDPIRIAFALLGPIVLAIAMANGISFDVEKLAYAVLDQDQSQESQAFLDNFAGSRYFEQGAPIFSQAELDARLLRGEIKFGLVIPPRFGKDLLSARRPEVGVWFDGANTFQAETARGYVQGVLANYLVDFSRRETGNTPSALSRRY